MVSKSKNKRRVVRDWRLGFFGFFGFFAIPFIVRGEWLGLAWAVWFIWFIHFFPVKKGN